MRSKTHEHAFVQAPARLRANVPSCPYEWSAMDISGNSCRLRSSGASGSPHPTNCAPINHANSRADNIQPYRILFRYSLLLITLSFSEITAYAEPAPLAGAPNRLIRKSQLIDPFNHTTRLKYMQEKSRQVLLSGLKLFMNT